MNTVWQVVCGALLTGVAAASFIAWKYERRTRIDVQKRLSASRRTCGVLEQQLHDLEVLEAHKMGLDAARQTDTLYQEFLSRMSASEQATMLLNGQKHMTNVLDVSKRRAEHGRGDVLGAR